MNELTREQVEQWRNWIHGRMVQTNAEPSASWKEADALCNAALRSLDGAGKTTNQWGPKGSGSFGEALTDEPVTARVADPHLTSPTPSAQASPQSLSEFVHAPSEVKERIGMEVIDGAIKRQSAQAGREGEPDEPVRYDSDGYPISLSDLIQGKPRAKFVSCRDYDALRERLTSALADRRDALRYRWLREHGNKTLSRSCTDAEKYLPVTIALDATIDRYLTPKSKD